MTLHLAIVVSDTHAPGAPVDDLTSDRLHVLAPLLAAMEARPGVRLALHLSQTFLDHISEHGAQLVPQLQALAKKKRITFLCSPVRGGVPWLGLERDAVGQLKQHRTNLERTFSVPVRGAWPVGLAWHPSWPRFLGRVGLRYTLCDRRALIAGGGAAPIRSWMKVRSESHRTAVLPFDADLVHRIPHAGPAEVLGQLRTHAEQGCLAQVLVLPMGRLSRWGQDTAGQYLTRLLDGLARQGGWLRTVAPGLLLERAPAMGTVHPPASTPMHVGVGALAEGPGRRLLNTANSLAERRDLVLEAQVPGITGPPLDAAFLAWPASGRLVDRAARVSAALAGLRRRAMRDKKLQPAVVKATRALHQGTSSAALWDGDGGCVGEPLTRHTAWAALTEAEDVLWKVRAKKGPEVDTPEDGGPVHLRTAHFVAAVDPVGGAIVELSVRGMGNLVNVLTPAPRPWGDRFVDQTLPCLVDDPGPDDPDEPTDASTAPPTDPGPALLPDLAPVESLTHAVPQRRGPRSPVPQAPIHTDVYGLPERTRPLALFQDLLLRPRITTDALARGMAPELGDFADGDWRVERAEVDGADVELLLVREGTVRRPSGTPGMVQVTKRIRFGGDAPTVTVRWTAVNRSRETVRTRMAVVLPLNVDGQLSPDRTLHVPGALPRAQDATGSAEGVADFALRYGDLGLLVRARPEHPVRVDHFPLTAPVRRRTGHVGVHQGTVAVLSWPLELWGEETREASMVLEIHKR